MPRPSDLDEVAVADADEFPIWEGGAWRKTTFARVKTWIRSLFSAYPTGIVIETDDYEVFRIRRPADGYDLVKFDVNKVVGGGGTNPAIYYFRSPSTPASSGGYLDRKDDYSGAPIAQVAFEGAALWGNDNIKFVPYYSGAYHLGMAMGYLASGSNKGIAFWAGEVANEVSTVVERGVTVTIESFKGRWFRLNDSNEWELAGPWVPALDNQWKLGTRAARWAEVNAVVVNAGNFTIPPVGIYFDGTTVNYISTPDAAALDITGDIDLRWGGALDDWTPASVQTLTSKWTTSTNNRSYHLSIGTDGKINLNWSPDGTAVLTETSTVAPTVTDGAFLAVRATLDVNDGAGNRVTTFYTSTDYNPDTGNGTWTQLGSTVTTVGTTSIFSGSAALHISGINTAASNQIIGRFCWAEVRNGINGTVVAAPNANVAQGVRFRDSAKRVWTLNGSAYAFEKAA